MSLHVDNYATAAQEIVKLVGNDIVIGVPLGLGKPIGILNALYQLASTDSSLSLTIITALTFSRPSFSNELEKQLIEPILDRVLGDYEDPLYEKPRELQQLPANIKVIEFFLAPGKFLHNRYVQRNYISSNYTNVVRDAMNLGINVLAQLVAPPRHEPDVYSISCNTDLFHGIREQLLTSGKKMAIVAEVNGNLPYMYGETAEVPGNQFSIIADTLHYKSLFAIVREEVTIQDHQIGIYTSSLIPDDGCLQIGIGKLSSALANALIFRHKNNDLYQKLLVNPTYAGTFDKGLYASTEMLSDEYFQLYNEGILKKKVYDHAGLQTLLNAAKITETITPSMLDILIDNKIINPILTAADLSFLKKFGIFQPNITLTEHKLIMPNGESTSTDMNVISNREKISKYCLGDKLLTGKLIHAGFFFGSIAMYEQLRNMTPEALQEIAMVSIARTNSLLWSPALLTLQRKHARFVNSSLMVTLLGGVISDGLINYQEVSGVGGQYDFVSMADQLEDARSIINCRSTRETSRGVESNIIWDYPNSTLPRYLRDIVVTEYGIADCRSKTDEDVIKAMLNISDSRFQKQLLISAKNAGKIANDYQIPAAFKHNYPDNINEALHDLRRQGYFKPYPFDSDLTPIEEELARVLLHLKNQTKLKLYYLIVKSLFQFSSDKKYSAYLQRMNLQHPKNIRDFINKKLLQYVLK